MQLGWELTHDDLGNAYLNAPDHKVRLGFLPEGDDDGLWRINAYVDRFGPPAWGVSFNDSCPTEFVTAFTTALAQAYQDGTEHYLAQPDPTDPELAAFNAVAPLINRGWQIQHPRWGVMELQTPDGMAGLEYATGRLDAERELTTLEARWYMWGGPKNGYARWYATASTNTPTPLVKAITQSVSDPAPLPRWKDFLSRGLRDHAQLVPVTPPPPVPTPSTSTAPRRDGVPRSPRAASRAGAPPRPLQQSCPRVLQPAPLTCQIAPLPVRSCALHAQQFFDDVLELPFYQYAIVGDPCTQPRSRTRSCGCASASPRPSATASTTDCACVSSTPSRVSSTPRSFASPTTAPLNAATPPAGSWPAATATPSSGTGTQTAASRRGTARTARAAHRDRAVRPRLVLGACRVPTASPTGRPAHTHHRVFAPQPLTTHLATEFRMSPPRWFPAHR
ncbi:DUF317 domain-containing protein [Streptomyces sp. M10(2022)]